MAGDITEDEAEKAQTEASQDTKVSENAKEDGEVIAAEEDEKNGETKKVEEKTEKEDEKINVNVANAKEIDKGECSSSSSSNGNNQEENRKEIEKGEPSSTISKKNEFPYDLNEHEKKALVELRSKLEHAISTNMLFKKDKKQESHMEEKEISKNNVDKNEKSENSINKKEEKSENSKEDEANIVDKGKAKVEEKEGVDKPVEGAKVEKLDKNIALFGVPLLPSKGDKGTDVLLLKFLKAKEFRVNDAFEMLKNTLEWRKENKIDSIMEEDFGHEFVCVGYMNGLDREGHPVCYNVYGVFGDEEVYNKTFGTEASRERFLRWRLQLMEKEVRKLDFSPGGISSLVQINDLNNAPLPSRKDLRLAMKRALGIFQDNYPEFIARNIFINVPLWYYAFSALISPFLTQAAKSKFVLCRPSKVTETLLKYMSAEEIPVVYGGLRKEKDPDFSVQDYVSEVNIKAGGTETIEIPASEVGNTLIWDLTIIGWDVNYKEEFIPSNEESYTVIVKKPKKISWQDESIRNSFKINNEPGKIVITIDNGMFRKKRVLYRYKTKITYRATSSAR